MPWPTEVPYLTIENVSRKFIPYGALTRTDAFGWLSHLFLNNSDEFKIAVDLLRQFDPRVPGILGQDHTTAVIQWGADKRIKLPQIVFRLNALFEELGYDQYEWIDA